MLSLNGDLHKEAKGAPKSFERALDEDTAILKNYEFEVNTVYQYLNDNKLLSSCQTGFCSFHSTLTDLLEATNSWSVNINNSFLNGVVFIDLKKAFATIDHEIILHKLSYFGAAQATIEWFQSYLGDRTQKCHVNGSLSTLLLVVYRGAVSWVPCFFKCILTITLTACGMLRRECLLMTPL